MCIALGGKSHLPNEGVNMRFSHKNQRIRAIMKRKASSKR